MTTPEDPLRAAAREVLGRAEPDDDFDGAFIEYLVPAVALNALRAALAAPPVTGAEVEVLADLRDAIELMDTKVTPYGERDDGSTASYIIADSTWHRVLAIARGSKSDRAQAALDRFRDAEVIDRLTRALRVATHSPHDQDGEPNEGFPVCSVCGAIQTAPPVAGAEVEAAWAALRNGLSKAYVAIDIDNALATARPHIEAALRSAAPALEVGRLARAMDAADPPIEGHDEENHADHLAYAIEIAQVYAALEGASGDPE